MTDDWTPPPFPRDTREDNDRDYLDSVGIHDSRGSKYPARYKPEPADPFDDLEPIDPDQEIPW